MEQEEAIPPMVFVSHASEDKDRFVIAFATKLRENGVNAWVDKWEIHPGDSLVDKIFEVGIGGAQAILIVLSRHSVDKPWVRQELDASVVERIKRGTRIIPIVLDDCAVPVSLQSTLYVRVADLNNYEAELKSIIDTIYEYSQKPPLGSPPTYVQMILEVVPGLKREPCPAGTRRTGFPLETPFLLLALPTLSTFLLFCPVAPAPGLLWPWHAGGQVVTGTILTLLGLDGLIVHGYIVLHGGYILIPQ